MLHLLPTALPRPAINLSARCRAAACLELLRMRMQGSSLLLLKAPLPHSCKCQIGELTSRRTSAAAAMSTLSLTHPRMRSGLRLALQSVAAQCLRPLSCRALKSPRRWQMLFSRHQAAGWATISPLPLQVAPLRSTLSLAHTLSPIVFYQLPTLTRRSPATYFRRQYLPQMHSLHRVPTRSIHSAPLLQLQATYHLLSPSRLCRSPPIITRSVPRVCRPLATQSH